MSQPVVTWTREQARARFGEYVAGSLGCTIADCDGGQEWHIHVYVPGEPSPPVSSDEMRERVRRWIARWRAFGIFQAREYDRLDRHQWRTVSGEPTVSMNLYVRGVEPVASDALSLSMDGYSGRGEELRALDEVIEEHRRRIIELGKGS